MIKYKEIEVIINAKKYNITIGDELPAGIVSLAKVYIAKKRKSKSW
jgi:DNA-directed RNA polymerase subunit beta